MSVFDFGDDGTVIEPQIQDQQGPKWFREYMDKVSGQLKSLQERNEQLEQAQRQTQVAEALKAKGYAPEAAGLYSGKPDELDTWLGTYGAGLARAASAAEGEQQTAPQGPPQTTVSAESQAAQAAFSAAGTDGTPALSGEDALVARMNAAKTEEEYAAIMREAGNRFFR